MSLLGRIFGKRRRRPALSARSFNAQALASLVGDWRWDGGFSNTEVSSALPSLRAKSRDMAKNSPQIARFVSLFACNVVGEGFRLEALPSVGNYDIAVDAEAKKAIEYAWKKWSDNPYFADTAKRKTLSQIFQLAARNWARDGEAFILIDRHARNRYGVSLRVVRPDCVDETVNRRVSDTVVVRNGVEVNLETDEPLAYWFNAGRADTNGYAAASETVRIPAQDVIHVFTQEDAGQTRGLPLTAPALCMTKMLEQYVVAEQVAAKDEASTVGVFSASGAAAELNPEDVGEMESVLPGRKAILPEGWTYETRTPQHPNRELTAFKNSMVRDIASALNVEYANFANDWSGVSYSSVRAGTLSERDMWRTRQREFVDQCVNRVYFAWLRSFLSLRVSGRYTMDDFYRFEDHEFHGRSWQWVDPMKDVSAAETAVRNGWKTDAQIAAEFGTDIDDNLEEQARVAALRAGYGLGTPSAASSVKAYEEKDEEEDGEGSDGGAALPRG